MTTTPVPQNPPFTNTDTQGCNTPSPIPPPPITEVTTGLPFLEHEHLLDETGDDEQTVKAPRLPLSTPPPPKAS